MKNIKRDQYISLACTLHPEPCTELKFAWSIHIEYTQFMRTYHYTISGRVQGVAFRHYTIREAERLGISGTVRNMPDGNVEVFAQGDEAEIAQFESFLHTGPRSASVERVEKEVLDQQGVFRGFDISW